MRRLLNEYGFDNSTTSSPASGQQEGADVAETEGEGGGGGGSGRDDARDLEELHKDEELGWDGLFRELQVRS